MRSMDWTLGNAFVLVLALLLCAKGFASCGCHGNSNTPYIGVLADQFRSTEYNAPLTADARADLHLFLVAGSNRVSNDDSDCEYVVSSDADNRWGGAFDLLKALQFLKV